MLRSGIALKAKCSWKDPIKSRAALWFCDAIDGCISLWKLTQLGRVISVIILLLVNIYREYGNGDNQDRA